LSGPNSHPRALIDDADGAILGAGRAPLSAGELSGRFRDRVAIVIPAFDEAANLSELLPRIPTTVCGEPAAVLVVDDGSADDTSGAAERAGAAIVRLPLNRGGGSALRVGYALMVDAEARIVVTMDADGQHRPEDLDRVAEPVLSGRAQLAQGSRTLGHNEPGAVARELGIVLFNRLVRMLTRVSVTDCSNSFRAIRTELLPELDLRQPQFHAAEFLIEAITRGISLEEVPVSVLGRRHGSSKKPATLRYGFGFCRAIVAAWRRSLARRADPRDGRAAAVEPIPANPGGGRVASGRSSPSGPQ
jgi:glycosyltransferase involved in cell wall biosynthesis